ncbi:MAG TPA: LuxR C-terminal-related transcriptional regulator [Solirubrobacter sp.]|nr:LuxR C-terminal-related transcriptional regulator [Solirubrobacter sp.]
MLTKLGEHYVAGRLTGDEHAERSDAAAEARTIEELHALLADLAQPRPSALRLHAIAFAAGSVVLLATWWLTRDDTPLPTDEGAGYYWAVWVVLVWAALLALHAARARLKPPPSATRPDLAALTPRERQILELVAQGQANKEIAATLGISERTARTHVSHVLRKLDVSSRTQAALLVNRADSS